MKATASRILAICAIAVCISLPSAVCQNPYYGSVPDVLSLVNVGGNIQMAQFARLDFAQMILEQQRHNQSQMQLDRQKSLLASGTISTFDLAAPHKAVDEFNKALTNLRAQRSLEVVGTYNGSVRYRALDVVALNGASFAARTDDPGPCPGDGWQLIASQGKKGPAGADGRNGRDGKDAPTIVDWAVNRENFTATPVMSNGSRGAVLDLHPLFARFYAQTEGIPEKVEGVP